MIYRAMALLGRAEASPTQVIPIEIFRMYIYIYIGRTSFRTVYIPLLFQRCTVNIFQLMRMRNDTT